MLAWKDQPRAQGCFVPHSQTDTIALATTTTLLDNSSSISSTPTSESSLMSSSIQQPSDYTTEYLFEDSTYPRLPPPPTNTPTPPSPKPQTSPLQTMQLENIPEFSGTQEDKTQPSDFLKALKRSFLANGTMTNESKISLFELFLKSDSPA